MRAVVADTIGRRVRGNFFITNLTQTALLQSGERDISKAQVVLKQRREIGWYFEVKFGLNAKATSHE